MNDFEHWPFAPVDNLPESLQDRWWEECFVPTATFETLQNQPHWAVVVGNAGCGKSTLLRAIKHARHSTDIVLDLSLGFHPQGSADDSNMLKDIMISAAREFSYRISDCPASLEKISMTQREFLRWIIEKFLGRRPYLVFLDGLDSDSRKIMGGVEFVELYATQTETLDVQGQITELSNFVRSLGYQTLLVIIDTVPYASEDQLKKLVDFLGWLEPMHHRGFVIMSAISQPLFDLYRLEDQMRGRVKIVDAETSVQGNYRTVEKRLSIATSGKIQNLGQIADRALLNRLEKMIEQEFGLLRVGPLINLTELLLELMKQGAKLGEQEFEHIRCRFYQKYLPLRLGKQAQRSGVWRGHKFIPLDAGVYELLERLTKSKVENWGGVGGNEYLHKLASRLRQAIEPDSKNPLYLQNRRNEGYWLNGLAEK